MESAERSTNIASPPRLRLVDQRIGPELAQEIDAELAAGATVVIAPRPDDAVAASVCGVQVEADHPHTEWFVTLAQRAEAARLDDEVALTATLRPLEPCSDRVEVAATVSLQFRHRPVITVRDQGPGRVIAVGLADLAAAIEHPTVGRFIERLGRRHQPRTDEVGVAVVGYGPFGAMGYLHGLACRETAGLSLVAAVDPVTERLEAAGRDFPGVRGYTDVEALLDDEGVELVIVATPPVHHAELAQRLLRAGRHVVIEKPMCLTLADADTLLDEAAAAGRTLTVHQSRRWDTDYLALRRAIGQGRIGEVFNIETFVGGFEHPCRAWHSEETISGGAIYDWGSHHVDWILQLYGSPPAEVMCTTHTRRWHDTTNVDQLDLLMRWPDGREASFRQSDLAAIRRPKFYVQGTSGTIEGHYRPLAQEDLVAGRGLVVRHLHHAEAPVELRCVRYEDGYGLVDERLPPAPNPGWAFHANLADHLLLGEPLAVDPTESRQVVAVLEAGHRSGADGGRPVSLS